MHLSELFADDWAMHREVVLLMGGGLLLLLLFLFLNHARWFGAFFRRLFPGLRKESVVALSEKAGGVWWLGVVPILLFAMLFPLYKLHWMIGVFSINMLWWFLALAPLPVLIAWFNSKSPIHQEQYPQVREPEWSNRLLRVDLGMWMLYLLGYEAFFRGFLLFGLMDLQVPVWIAIAINTVIYSLAHIPKGKGEAFGAIPLGVLLCLAAISTGSFWVPFAVHVVMAWSNELFTLKHHRTIHSSLNKNKR